ncbi:MAG: BrnT family toxin [Chloroflexi bacterium]|nr:BrnT family toxin [Chloroflexota bacterium]
MHVEYEWDEGKRNLNHAKHGVDFSEIEAFEWDTAVIDPSTRHGELRHVAIGFIGDRLHQLVFTMRGRSCRIVSLRKANPRESRRYERGK